MPTAKRRRLRPEGPLLSRDDWLDAAHAAVVAGGFDNLRVLKIAQALQVTRGSFYWHFSGHADLQAALLARWRLQQLAIADTLRAAPADNPQADLERVLETALAQIGPRREHLQFELSLRALGRRDAEVAGLLAEVDTWRLCLFEEKFLQLTGHAQRASELAVLFYLAVVGSHQALGRPTNPPNLKDYLQRLIATYLIRDQAPQVSRSRDVWHTPTP
jgi:AcrR family transcriptional regulator